MSDYEGTQVFLSNPQEKIKHLMRVANAKDEEIRSLRSQLEQTKLLLEEQKEKAARLHGILTIRGRDKKKITKTAKVKWRRPKGTPEGDSVRNEEEQDAKYNDVGSGWERVGLMPETGQL